MKMFLIALILAGHVTNMHGMNPFGADTRKAIDNIQAIIKANKVKEEDLWEKISISPGFQYPLNISLTNVNASFFTTPEAQTLLFLLLEFGSYKPEISTAATACIKKLLEQGATFDLSMKDSSNNNLLHMACLHNNKLAVEKILAQDTAKTLINKVNATGYTPLYNAVQQDEQLVKMLIDAGANVNAVNEHESYDWTQGKKIASKRTPLHMNAINSNNPAIAPLLIKAGADVNAQDIYNTTPLHLAAWYEHEQIVNALLENGAQVNAQTNTLGNWDTDGATALHEAAWRGNLEIVKQLIDHGASLTLKNKKGQTPLVCAISALQFSTAVPKVKEVIKYLIKHGATFNVDEIRLLLDIANVKKALLDMKILKATKDRNIYELNFSTKATKSLLEEKLDQLKQKLVTLRNNLGSLNIKLTALKLKL